VNNPTWKSLPDKPGIYKLYSRKKNGDLKLLYIGETSSIRDRVFGHEKPGWDEVTFEVIEDHEDRKYLEEHLIREFEPPLNKKYTEVSDESTDQSSKNQIPLSQLQLNKKPERLFKDILKNPFKSVTDRYENFSSRYQGNKAKKVLIKHNLIDSVDVSVGNGSITLFDLTERGLHYSKNQDYDRYSTGKGGIEHRYWQHKIKELLSRTGFDTELEKHDIDVYGNSESFRIGFEVAMGKSSREIEHVKKNIEYCDYIVVAAKGPAVKEYIDKEIGDTKVDRSIVDVRTISEIDQSYVDSVDDN